MTNFRQHVYVAWLISAALCLADATAQPDSGQTAPATNNTAVDKQQAIQWLERMALAMEQLSYKGTFVYRQGDQMQSLAVVHIRRPEGIRERVYSLEGDVNEIRRIGNLIEARVSDKDFGSLVNYTQFTRLGSAHLMGNNNAYQFKLGPRKRIASNIAQQVSVMPRDNLRYGYEYWLEIRTGMLLKQLLLDTKGRPLEELVFTSIELGGNIPEELLEAERDQSTDSTARSSAAEASQQRSRQLAVTSNWQPVATPMYFQMLNHQRSMNADGTKLDHLLFSDGIAHVSVYLEPINGEQDDREFAPGHAGVINIYTRTMDNTRITAMGTVPYKTLRMLGGSMIKTADLKAILSPQRP